jgi:hypothetical protein
MNHLPIIEPIAGALAGNGYRPAIDRTRSA